MKRISILALTAGIAVSAWAIPARQGVRTFTQPDGSKISLTLVGDEYSHNYISSDGTIMKRGSDGFFRPVSQAEAAERHAAGISRRARRNLPLRRAAQENFSQVPHVGSPRVPILLVQYKDYKFKDQNPKATFESFFSSGQKSAHQYFLDQSNGKFDCQFDVYGPITLKGNRVDYGGNDWWGNDVGVGTMVGEACVGLDSSIDFSRYDNDGDGECDVVIVLYAGDGEASSADRNAEDSVWPCQWELEGSDYGKSLNLDNTKVNLFAVFNELYGEDLSKIDGIGTFCHEFSHCLGLPDFYDTQYGPHFGMGNWSIMDHASYNDDGYTPLGYSAYEKEYMGWIDIPEATENTLYTLTPMNLKEEATDMAVRLTNSADPDEYYILENRKKQGWDAFMPAEGLLISHFTYDTSAWVNNEVNDYDLQRATIIPADNSLKLDKQNYYGEIYYYINEADQKGDLWPYAGHDELTDTSVPAAKVNKGGFMSKPITEITRNNDGTISFYAMRGALPAVEVPSALAHEILSSTSAKINWECDDENAGAYNLEVSAHAENPFTLLSETLFNSDSHGWGVSGYAFYDDAVGGVRLGSNKQQGSLTSPVYAVEDNHGNVTVSLSVKHYNAGDRAVARVSLLDAADQVKDTQDVDLTDNYTANLVTFNASAGQKFKIRIETVGNKKRVCVESVSIYSGEGVAEAALKAPALPMLFEGLKEKSHIVTGLTAGGLYDYRVRALPADETSHKASEWSPKVLLDLSGVTGIEVLPVDPSAPERWITLQGVQLAGRPSAPGIYIHVSNGKTQKVIIR
ncbi:MAG: M6 family metalloprotease domain-containing protein [Muribaculaceae bacterium]|nr:M6 family metalloprotease domain-containing protein [Muribaculaceae bacterium]